MEKRQLVRRGIRDLADANENMKFILRRCLISQCATSENIQINVHFPGVQGNIYLTDGSQRDTHIAIEREIKRNFAICRKAHRKCEHKHYDNSYTI